MSLWLRELGADRCTDNQRGTLRAESSDGGKRKAWAAIKRRSVASQLITSEKTAGFQPQRVELRFTFTYSPSVVLLSLSHFQVR